MTRTRTRRQNQGGKRKQHKNRKSVKHKRKQRGGKKLRRTKRRTKRRIKRKRKIKRKTKRKTKRKIKRRRRQRGGGMNVSPSAYPPGPMYKPGVNNGAYYYGVNTRPSSVPGQPYDNDQPNIVPSTNTQGARAQTWVKNQEAISTGGAQKPGQGGLPYLALQPIAAGAASPARTLGPQKGGGSCAQNSTSGSGVGKGVAGIKQALISNVPLVSNLNDAAQNTITGVKNLHQTWIGGTPYPSPNPDFQPINSPPVKYFRQPDLSKIQQSTQEVAAGYSTN